MNDAIETGGNQFGQSTHVAKIAGDKLDSTRGATKPLGVKVINRDVVLLGQELIDDMGSQKTRPTED